MKKLYSIILILSVSFASAQISKYLRKGSKALSRNKIELAKNNYLKAYTIDKTSYEANAAVGYVLSEYYLKYEEALPYLETAYNKSPKDTFPDLLYALAKCYQHFGENQKAYNLFNKLYVQATKDKKEDRSYVIDLKKRNEDCLFYDKNKEVIIDKNVYIGNVGPKVNTDLGEYVPVLNDKNELYFTSRRKDVKREKRSKIDDKYFENIYVSKIVNGKPQAAQTYTISKKVLKTNIRKRHLSIISSTSDEKTMFVFQKNKILEIRTGADDKKTVVASLKNINIDYYQNHASQSKDGKTLLFTSEDSRGNGGIDIYKSVKDANGNWAVPENLGKTINTEFDEDSPFLSDDGQTLYFSSKGHEGFGNYDIYKSTYANGSWSTPVNVGLPINSAGHDVFMTESNAGDYGYFSSYREGGYGDMDIYKITYLDKFKKECAEPKSSLLTLDAKLIDKATDLVSFEATMPANIKAIAYQWTFNQTKLPTDATKISQISSNTETGDSVYVKVIAGCDTCIEPIVFCNYTKYKKPKEDIVVIKPEEPGKNPYDDKLILPYLNKTSMDAIGFNVTPIQFNLNKADIRKDAISILEKNIEVLSKNPDLSVLIYGFADSRGSEVYNLPLSKKRAQHVRDYLIAKGVNKNQIEQVVPKGEKFILNTCTDGVECQDTEHEINRRVEFIIFKNK